MFSILRIGEIVYIWIGAFLSKFHWDSLNSIRCFLDFNISIIILLVAGLASFPVIGLAVFHTGLIALGRTTNEQVFSCGLEIVILEKKIKD